MVNDTTVDASGRGHQCVVMVTCAECGKLSSRYVVGWRDYRSDDPNLGESPELAFYCTTCAGRAFGG